MEPVTKSHRRVPRIAIIIVVVVAGCVALLVQTRKRGEPAVQAMTTQQLRDYSSRKPSAESLGLLFKRLHGAGQNDEAFAVAKRFTTLFPMDARAHNLMGISFVTAADSDNAEREFHSAISLNPKDVDPYVNIGRLALLMGDTRRAEIEFDRATAVNPTSASAWTGFGEAEAALQNQQDSIQAFKKAIQLAPNRPEAYAHLGTYMAEMGQGDQARQYLLKALALNLKTGRVYSGLAMAFADMPESDEDLKKALEYADQAEKLGDRGSLTQYARGLALQRMGKYQEAIGKFRKVIAISENANGPWIGISQCYRALGNTKLAEQAATVGERILTQSQHMGNLRYRIQTNPDRLDLRQQYADLMMANGQYLMAADQYRYVAMHCPNQPEKWLKAAEAFKMGGENDLADYVRKLAVKGGPARPTPKRIVKGN